MSTYTKSVTVRFTQEDAKIVNQVMSQREIFKISEVVRLLFQEEQKRLNDDK